MGALFLDLPCEYIMMMMMMMFKAYSRESPLFAGSTNMCAEMSFVFLYLYFCFHIFTCKHCTYCKVFSACFFFFLRYGVFSRSNPWGTGDDLEQDIVVVFQEMQENSACPNCWGGGLQTGFPKEASSSLSLWLEQPVFWNIVFKQQDQHFYLPVGRRLN